MSKPGEWWDRSLNLWEGCTRISEACEHCWAMGFLNRFRDKQPEGEIRHFPERINTLSAKQKPQRIFVESLSDVFHPKIPTSKLWILWDAIRNCPQHTFILLTKRPAQALERIDQDPVNFDERFFHLSNMWFLVTTENQARFDERIRDLAQIHDDVRGISAEPLLGPINLGPAAKWLNWVIVGGETGPGARPMRPEWVRSLRDQCQTAGIAFWFKSWGAFNLVCGRPNDDEAEVNDRLMYYGDPCKLVSPKKHSGPACAGWLYAKSLPERDFVKIDNRSAMMRLGRGQKAGRLLDGREWSELPEVRDEIKKQHKEQKNKGI